MQSSLSLCTAHPVDELRLARARGAKRHPADQLPLSPRLDVALGQLHGVVEHLPALVYFNNLSYALLLVLRTDHCEFLLVRTDSYAIWRLSEAKNMGESKFETTTKNIISDEAPWLPRASFAAVI